MITVKISDTAARENLAVWTKEDHELYDILGDGVPVGFLRNPRTTLSHCAGSCPESRPYRFPPRRAFAILLPLAQWLWMRYPAFANNCTRLCGDCQLLNLIYQIFSLADRHKIVRLPCAIFQGSFHKSTLK